MTRTATPTREVSVAHRWGMLGAGTLAQAASSVMSNGPAFLIPALHADGFSLAQAGLISSAPLVGIMLSLVAWGYVVDRRGERFALLSGLGVVAVGGLVATQAPNLVTMWLALFAAGLGGAATNSASGRVVVGWFPPQRRGLAMGIRQMAQPLGVGFAAVTMAVTAQAYGIEAALWIPTGAAILAFVTVALVIVDPPRPPASERATYANPYRADSFLARVHAVSVLLVVPQFLVWTFAFTWLVTDQHWSAGAAGGVVAGAQLAGAAARVAAGWISDLVGSRMRPLRWVSASAAVAMAGLGVSAAYAPTLAVVLLVFASAVTVADNGLAFTAIAERAGPFFSGRALGLQNTAQHLAASAVPPVAGLAIAAVGYPVTFALAGLLPLVATGLVPADPKEIDTTGAETN